MGRRKQSIVAKAANLRKIQVVVRERRLLRQQELNAAANKVGVCVHSTAETTYEENEVKIDVKEESISNEEEIHVPDHMEEDASWNFEEDEPPITINETPAYSTRHTVFRDPLQCSSETTTSTPVVGMNPRSNGNGQGLLLGSFYKHVASTMTQSLYKQREPNASNADPLDFKCILCYHTVKRSMKVGTASLKDQDQLVMFVLQKMFQVPKENITTYLNSFGDPKEWITYCDDCAPLIRNAFNIQKSINELQKNLLECQNKMQGKIRRTWSAGERSLPRATELPLNCNGITNETRSYVVGSVGNIGPGQKYKEKPDVTINTQPTLYVSVPVAPITIFVPAFGTNLVQTVTTNPVETPPETERILSDKDAGGSDDDGVDHCASDSNELSSNVQSVSCNSIAPTAKPSTQVPNWLKKDSILDDTGYNCVLCPKMKAMDLHSYIKHVLYHYKRPYQCSICGCFYVGDQLELTNSPMNALPEKTHTCALDTLTKREFEPGKVWECGHCPELFKFEAERDSHEEDIHCKNPSIPLYHSCSLCSKIFRNAGELRLHRALTHPEIAFFSCFYCDESFKYTAKEGAEAVNFFQMRVHMKLHHNNTNRQILDECDLCGDNFYTSVHLVTHFESAHKIDKCQALSCPICYKRLKNRVSAQYHLKRHFSCAERYVDETKQICDLCGYTSRNDPMLEHKLRKHDIEPPQGRTVHVCSQENCSFRTLLKSSFEIHMIKCHDAPRKFKCKHCDKGFICAKQLKEHMEIHDNAITKPFQCEICGNSFAVKNYLYIHMRLSHQNRPFASTHKKKPTRGRKKPRTDNVTHNSQTTATSAPVPVKKVVNKTPESDKPPVAINSILPSTSLSTMTTTQM